MKKVKNVFKKITKKRTKRPLLPKVSLPYNQAVRLQQKKWMITLFLLLGISGFYTYFYVKSYRVQHEIVMVMAAKSDLKSPHEIGASDLQVLEIPRKSLPVGIFEKSTLNTLVGKVLVRDLVAKEILVPSDFQASLDPKSISAKFEESFAFSLDEDWFAAKFPIIKKNDLIDILVSNPEADFEATASIVFGVKVIAVQSSGNKKTLILNLTEEQSKSVLFSRGLRLPMQLLVHSAIKKEDPLTPNSND